MINGDDALPVDDVLIDLKATSKKHALQELARAAGDRIALSSRAIFDAVFERERMGSTGVGHGVAIPHARLRGLDRIAGVFARLDQPIDVDAIDGEPADLFFLLLAPEESGADHLRALARVSRAFRRPELREALRKAPSVEAARLILLGETAIGLA